VNERPKRPRLNPDEIEARTRAILIITLAAVLGTTVIAMLYGLLFVYQPDKMAEADAKMFEILGPLAAGITGALTGLAAGGAIRRKRDNQED